MRLLIVDDNKGMRNIIRSIVAESNDIVVECEDGEQAVVLYSSFKPDWVLMDYEMKHKDGITATREILHINSKAKVVMISQYCDEEVIDSAREAGAIGFVHKSNILKVNEIIKQKEENNYDNNKI